MSCHFCNIAKLKDRIFYDNHNWIGFLAAPYHTKGHTILAANNISGCPDKLTNLHSDCWDKLGIAMKEVSETILEYYNPDDALYSSVRGDIPHFHFHLLPLWPKELEEWRREKRYVDKGHLLEFLGHLEHVGDYFYEKERSLKEYDSEKQRDEIIKLLAPHIRALRKITGYKDCG